jgi:hypothetical protein
MAQTEEKQTALTGTQACKAGHSALTAYFYRASCDVSAFW